MGRRPAASAAFGVLTGKIKLTELATEAAKGKLSAFTGGFKAIGSLGKTAFSGLKSGVLALGGESCKALESCVGCDDSQYEGLMLCEENTEVCQPVYQIQSAVHNGRERCPCDEVENRLTIDLQVCEKCANSGSQLSQLIEGGAVFADHLADAAGSHAEKLHRPVFEGYNVRQGFFGEALAAKSQQRQRRLKPSSR